MPSEDELYERLVERVEALEQKLPPSLIPAGRQELNNRVGELEGQLKNEAARLTRSLNMPSELTNKVSNLEGQLDQFMAKVVRLEAELGELSKRLDSQRTTEPKLPPSLPFEPLERVHLVELHIVMSLVRMQNWTIKDFIGFVEVRSFHPAEAHVGHIERRQRGRVFLTLEGGCLEDGRMDNPYSRVFAVIGERAAAAGVIFERKTTDRVTMEISEVRRYGEER